MTKMNVDLHYHGPASFHPIWLYRQGYAGKNILKEITDSCMKNDIDICTIVSRSSSKKVERGTADDRFWYLLKESRQLPEEYLPIQIGDNLLSVRRGEKTIYILNAQSVFVEHNGRMVESIIVGTNRQNNGQGMKELLRDTWFRDNLINIAEHPFSIDHCGLGYMGLEKFIDYYDAIEGHNSQFILPRFLGKIRKIGDYTRAVNERARAYAESRNKPWVATSDGHIIEEVGISHIEVEGISILSEESLLRDMKIAIRENRFTNICRYPKITNWLSWTLKFELQETLDRCGIKTNKSR